MYTNKANNNHAHTHANAIAKSYVYPRTYNWSRTVMGNMDIGSRVVEITFENSQKCARILIKIQLIPYIFFWVIFLFFYFFSYIYIYKYIQ